MCDRQHNNRISVNEKTNQLIDSLEIKQEPDIKVEPQPVGHLEESPAFNNELVGSSFVDLGQFGDQYNSVDVSIKEVKTEIKEESGEKNKKPTKSNDDGVNEPGLGKRQKKHLSRHDAPSQQFNLKNNAERNAKKATKRKIQERKMKRHQCKQCEYATKYRSNLKKHLLKHTGETPFKCSHCTKTFKSKHSLKYHMKVHFKDFLFSCTICLKGFDKKNDKIEHESNCEMIRYECHLCKMSFGPMKANLIHHMCVHSCEKPFECKECFKQFTRKCSLNKHMKIHARPRSFCCSICRQRFSLEDELIAHQQQCNRPAYECNVCGKLFRSKKSSLAEHMRTHTGEKPFGCNQCPKKFTQKTNLNVHIIIHSRSLPWKCAVCHQGFAKQTQSKAHQCNCRRRVYECFDCKMFFGSKCAHLMGHMMKHSGEKAFRCEICGNKFTLKWNLAKHIKSIHK